MRKRTNAYSLDEKLISDIAEIAAKQGLTASALVERVLKEAVDAYRGVESPFNTMTIFQLLDTIQAASKKKRKK